MWSLSRASVVGLPIHCHNTLQLGSFSAAGSLSVAEGRRVRGAFYGCGATGRILIGPLSDAVSRATHNRVHLHLYLLLAAILTTAAVALVTVVSYEWLLPAAAMQGLAFGAVSTLLPLLSRQLDAHMAGTLYGVAKVGCMVLSSAFMAAAAADPSYTQVLPCMLVVTALLSLDLAVRTRGGVRWGVLDVGVLDAGVRRGSDTKKRR